MDSKKKKYGFSYVEIVLSVVIFICLSFFAIKFYYGLDNLRFRALAMDFGKQIITSSNEIIYSCDDIDGILKNNFYYEYTFEDLDGVYTLEKNYIVDGKSIIHTITFTPSESNNITDIKSITYNETDEAINFTASDNKDILYSVKNYLTWGDEKFPEVEAYFVLKNTGELYEK